MTESTVKVEAKPNPMVIKKAHKFPITIAINDISFLTALPREFSSYYTIYAEYKQAKNKYIK